MGGRLALTVPAWTPDSRWEWILLLLVILAGALLVAELVYFAVMAWG